jgi:segregation and condensation protein A
VEIEDTKYKVNLPFFEGPLDLLLSLVEQSELDITEISLSEVTGQYREYLELLGDLDIEIESSYLVVFAQLLELKSRLLLPTIEPEDDGMLPGYDDDSVEDDLVARLREYQKLKKAAMWLAERESQSLARYPHPSGLSEPETPLLNVSRRSLYLAALRVLRPRKPFKEPIGYRKVELSVPERVEEIWTHLRGQQRRVTFSELLRREGDRKGLVVVTFLALLEMARRDRVTLYQDNYRSELECEIRESPDLDPNNYAAAPISLN